MEQFLDTAIRNYLRSLVEQNLIVLDRLYKDVQAGSMTEAQAGKIILCTGYSELIDQQQALDMGIAGCFNKPVGAVVLARTVRNVLNGLSP